MEAMIGNGILAPTAEEKETHVVLDIEVEEDMQLSILVKLCGIDYEV